MTKRMTASLVTLALALALTTGGTSCSDDRPAAALEPTTSTGTGTEVATGAPPPASEIAETASSTEVVNLSVVLDRGEVARGELARQRAASAEVQGYAARMVDEHTQALGRMQRIAEPTIPADATALVRQRHEQLIIEDLQGQSGAAFDVAYMTAQVAAHAEEIAMLERSLLPSVYAAGQGPSTTTPPAGLRGELQTMRAMVAAHLVEALQIQQRVRQAPGATPITPN